MAAAREAFRWSIYPLLVTSLVGGCYAGIRAGFDYGTVVVVVNLIGAVITALLERWMPYRVEWNRSREDVLPDFLHAIFSNIIAIQVARALVMGTLVSMGAALSEKLGTTLWPSHLPLALQVALGMVIGELPAYWFHRGLHELPVGWRVHAVHHSAERLYWLNGLRAHPIESVLLFLMMETPLILMGAPQEIFALSAAFFAANGLLQHSNVDHETGWLARVFATAHVHRWHHSTLLEEGNRNYAFNLVLWDQIFGTFILPRDREPPVTIGISDMPEFPRGYLAHLASPFRFEDLPRSAPSALDVRPVGPTR